MEKVRIYCENTQSYHEVEVGSELKSLADSIFGAPACEPQGTCSVDRYPLGAMVDGCLKDMSFRAFFPHRIRFVDYYQADGRRCYNRGICFLVQKAARELYPEKVLVIDYSLPNGLYCELRTSTEIHSDCPTEKSVLEALSSNIRKSVEENLRFVRSKITNEDACEIFKANGQLQKARLASALEESFISVYTLGSCTDFFHGPLPYSSGFLSNFQLLPYYNGFCIQLPSHSDFNSFDPLKHQSKLSTMLKNHSKWCSSLGVQGVGSLNQEISGGNAEKLVILCEARHERLYAEIANEIFAGRGGRKLVFIAGPSSSGKTSTSLRVANQCRILGLTPKVIELDNYFHDRELTPRDENGEYDFECLGALDLKLLNDQLNALLRGEEIRLPKFDFKAGRKTLTDKTLRLEENDILIMEGIHALNPAMTPDVPSESILRIYASALTSLSIDENNNISTIDNRLLRRIVRDNRTRGINPESTILRWPSVRRGENRNIFPFQENADLYFNSALVYEISVLKYYAEPLLRRIPPKSPAYGEALRLLNFLRLVEPMTPEEMAAIPPQSILREFIGGQILK